jgi:hypothetical protein
MEALFSPRGTSLGGVALAERLMKSLRKIATENL